MRLLESIDSGLQVKLKKCLLGCLLFGGLAIAAPAYTEAENTPELRAVSDQEKLAVSESTNPSAARPSAARLLAALLQPVDTFSATFEQRLQSSDGYVIQEVNGQLKAMRPGKFYWHTDAPLEQLVLTDGDKVWIYDPDLEQVSIQNISQQLANTPALLLSGDISSIEEQYHVEIAPKDGYDRTLFRLTPRSVDSLFDNLLLGFSQGKLAFMELRDTLGQKTSLILQDAMVNEGVSSSDFHFEIPTGVDVIREQ